MSTTLRNRPRLPKSRLESNTSHADAPDFVRHRELERERAGLVVRVFVNRTSWSKSSLCV